MYNLLPSRATGYVARRLAIFPLHPGSKLPATTHGASNAALDDSPWRGNPDLNIALHMGKNGLVLIDLDSHAHDDAVNPCKQGEADGLAWLEAARSEHGAADFQTWHSLTPTGGQHLFYRIPDSFDYTSLKQSGSIARHVDFKAGNQYAVVDPSLHPAGGYYSWNWTEGLDPFNCDVLDCPPWLLALLPRKVQPTVYTPQTMRHMPVVANAREQREAKRAAAYGLASLTGAVEEVAQAVKGERHNVILGKAHHLGRLARACNLDAREMERQLYDRCVALGWPNLDSKLDTIRDGLNSGLAAGRYLPAPPRLDLQAAIAARRASNSKAAQ